MKEPIPGAPWDDPAWRERVREFAARLGIPPEDEPLLIQALTHRSLAETAPHGTNERLEFLGDAVLALLVGEHLFRAHPDDTEGQLTRAKARYVSQPVLAQAAAALELGSLLAMGPGEEAMGGRARPSTLSDALEAVLAALYLSRGLEAARDFVHREILERVDPTVVWDYKSRLQELFQELRRATPVYRTAAEGGTDHEPIFRSEVLVDGEVLGVGTGRSKKAAEQAAAADALARLEAARAAPKTAPTPARPRRARPAAHRTRAPKGRRRP